jgi:quinol monooxygenase YgiN
MGEQVSWVVELAVKPGQLEGFRSLMQEMVESTSQEAGALSYEWFVSADGSAVHIYERYADSAAAVTHLNGFLERFAQRFLERVDVTRVSVYGDPNAEARAIMDGFGVTYYGPFGGFVR